MNAFKWTHPHVTSADGCMVHVDTEHSSQGRKNGQQRHTQSYQYMDLADGCMVQLITTHSSLDHGPGWNKIMSHQWAQSCGQFLLMGACTYSAQSHSPLHIPTFACEGPHLCFVFAALAAYGSRCNAAQKHSLAYTLTRQKYPFKEGLLPPLHVPAVYLQLEQKNLEQNAVQSYPSSKAGLLPPLQ
eukprot:scaffold321262_cov24-Tisochrysis_lutea.AAC.2